MIKEIKGRQVTVEEGKNYFFATIRDGKVTDMSMPYRENYLSSDVSVSSIQLYITLLTEILQAIKDTQ